ncbi:MipA/OmpV family protein [Sphingomonas gellani]|nr:MipA/OmpV family protein [Sphingomonas gellani]
MLTLCAVAAGTVAAALAQPALAQDAKDAPRRYRVALGPQVLPSYPGADGSRLRPLMDLDRARGDTPFPFEAPDESFGPGLLRTNGFEFGPAVGLDGRRTRGDTDDRLPRIRSAVEIGGFVNYQVAPAFRLRTEVRRGVRGHHGWISTIGADYVTRDADRWLFSLGPRVTLSDGRYNRTYFGISPADAVAAGLPAYRPGAGLQALGGTAGLIRQFTPHWGIYAYAKYDRLVDDVGRSPVLAAFGSRNQISGGAALTYTFGKGMR